MTRKDYQLIARAINLNLGLQRSDSNLEGELALYQLMGSLVSALERDNPRFAADKFKEACTKGNQ